MKVFLSTNLGKFHFHVSKRAWLRNCSMGTTEMFLTNEKERWLKRHGVEESQFTTLNVLLPKEPRFDYNRYSRSGELNKILYSRVAKEEMAKAAVQDYELFGK